MPVIIDANRSGDFTNPVGPHASEILRRIASNRMSIILGGKLLLELSKTKLFSLIVEWTRSGRVKRVDDNTLLIEEQRLGSLVLDSDDPHVLALAISSGCRLLYTADKALIRDFKNVKIMSPKGKVVTPSTKSNIACDLFDKFGI